MTARALEGTNPSSVVIATELTSSKRLWVGRVLSAVVSLFLLFDALGKLVQPVPIVKATVQLGYPPACIVWLGTVLLACTVLYLVPRTTALGAILLTGYLGGAVATHVRVSANAFNIVFPVLLGLLLWTGLALRHARVAQLFNRNSR